MILSLMSMSLLVTVLIGILCSHTFLANAQLSSREPWNSSAPVVRKTNETAESMTGEERKLFGKFLEQGEELFRRDCYKNVNVDDEYGFSEKFAKGLAEQGVLKQVCEDRINMLKRLNVTLFANQTSISNK